ncbi:MAG: DNA adenine methylase [Armatimonadota bacterium]
MHTFATDLDRIAFLLEADADLQGFLGLTAEGATQDAPVDGATEELPEGERPKYVTNYIGSKQKLIEWIWKHTPEGITSVCDAFSGSAVVAYMYKTKGLRVVANDRLRYAYHAARAIVENASTRISNEELNALLQPNGKAGTFVRDNFKGLFFADGVHAIIDQVRANIDALSGYKKDIALFALGKTCMSGKGGFGHFSSSTDYGKRQDTPEEFRERFAKNVARINALVFDNGKDCQANQKEINVLLPAVKVDLAYFDPPYATEFSTTNYEKSYHFVEGLMTYWDGLEIKEETKTHHYVTDHQTVTKANANTFFATFLGNAKHIPHWLISYRDHAYPNETEMRSIIADAGKDVSLRSHDHHYSISSRHGDASNAKEYLFICAGQRSATASQAVYRPANCHTSLPVEIHLSTEGQVATPGTGDPRFTCILCRVGTNKNGDHFLAEELAARAVTAINKKVDLQHSQDVTDIVGGIVGSDYIEDETGGRVECVGELFVQDAPNAQLAYRLMKSGIVTQVSMECDYSEGECSVCGKRAASKNDYCLHLRKYKGGDFQGQPVYEILHGVTFTGLGLLDRKGADENARITQVASREAVISEGAPMEQDIRDAAESEAAKKTPPPAGGDTPPANDAERVKALEKENQQLKQQLVDLQKHVDELLAAQKAAANRTKAQTLVRKLERQGMKFGSDEEKEAEIGRLAGLSDEAYAASEAAYGRMAQTVPGKADTTDKTGQADKTDCSCDKTKAAEQVTPPLKTDAGVRPLDVDDRNESLEDLLKRGFQQAYDERISRTQA